MGGYGSGRSGPKQKAEHRKSPDVNRLHREGCLRPGRLGKWIWPRNDEEVGRLGYKAEEGRYVLDFRVRVSGGVWEPIKQTIHHTHADSNFGSKRPYFRCPGVAIGRHCGRRVGKLVSGVRYEQM